MSLSILNVVVMINFEYASNKKYLLESYKIGSVEYLP